MTTRASQVSINKSWWTNMFAWRGSPWGFLGKNEGLYLYYLARDHYRGDGVIVDAGSFLGRSAWFLGSGLAANRRLGRPPASRIHCFDNFIVNDEFTREAIQREFGQDLPLGASIRPLFDSATRSVAAWLAVHEGDFQTCSWEPRPIEILFVDIAKSESLHQRLVELMFPCLIPGQSVVVQQDYHHPWLPYVHTSMEYLHEYFELVEPRVDDSAAFLLRRPIPGEALRSAARVHELPFAEQLALMDHAIARLPEGSRRHVELARARLLGQGRGHDAMRAALDEIDTRYPSVDGDERWGAYREQMSSVMAALRDQREG